MPNLVETLTEAQVFSALRSNASKLKKWPITPEFWERVENKRLTRREILDIYAMTEPVPITQWDELEARLPKYGYWCISLGDQLLEIRREIG